MPDDDQSEVVDFLSRGDTYGRPDETPKKIDTHASVVFLIGDRVFKLKRAVKFSFLDYSTLAKRQHFCRAEFELNRRTAPELYRKVRAITRTSAGGLEWDGSGPIVEPVLEMIRFDDEALFDRLAVSGGLTIPLMAKLADVIAAFHQMTEPVPAFGGADGLAKVIEDNRENLLQGCPPLERDRVEAVANMSNDLLDRHRNLLDARRAQKKVRHCHGDLHLSNICIFNGQPTLFDCIDFNEAMSCIDVLYDVAFLLMDIEHRQLRPLGNAVFNRYFDRMDEIDGLAALPLMMSIRAAIRAKVGIASRGVDAKAEEGAKAYLDLAQMLLKPARPVLIAIGGFSGSGKSTVGAGLAPGFLPAPGARHIRTDVVRKSLMDAAPETKLPPSAYTHAVSEHVYRLAGEQAAAALTAGYTAIIDATFIDEAERDSVAGIARRTGVPFIGLWLSASDAVLLERVAGRKGDASDADRAVLLSQLQANVGAMQWRQIDVSGDTAAALQAARAALAFTNS